MSAAPLYDLDAERALLGVAMIYASAAEAMLGQLVASDFGSPDDQATFAAIGDLRSAGAGIDAGTVHDQLKRNGAAWGTAAGDLVAWTADAPSSGSAPRYAEMVARLALRRRLAAEGTELATAARDLAQDPGDVLDHHRARLGDIDSPVMARSPGDVDVAEFIAQPVESAAVVIPGDLAEDDRMVIVAPEGVGKSELQRQFATTVSHGIHPFTFQQIEPAPSLLVDLENPHELVRARLRYLSGLATANAKGGRAPCTLWHRPGGVDLRKRADRLAFEDVLRRRRPRLVCLGPVYKSYQRRGSESDEQVATEVQQVLDDLRTRFRFALVLEHHAPQASNGYRDLRPFGSSLWLRWPEYGLSLKPDPDRPRQVLLVGRWRGDRSIAHWPDELHRGPVWPWEGRWAKGSFGTGDDPAF